MAKWKEDPQGRNFIDEVTQVMELPIYKAEADGEFRPWLKETWGKVEDNYTSTIGKLGDKYDKTGGPISGEVEIVYKNAGVKLSLNSPTDNSIFFQFLRGEERKAWLGYGVHNSKSFTIENEETKKSLVLDADGLAKYNGNEILDKGNTDIPKINKSIERLEKAIPVINESIDNLEGTKFDKSGGVITGNTDVRYGGSAVKFTIDGADNQSAFFEVQGEGNRKAWFGCPISGKGDVSIYSATANKALEISEEGILSFDGSEVWDDKTAKLALNSVTVNSNTGDIEKIITQRRLIIEARPLKLVQARQKVNFAISFPTACVGVVATDISTQSVYPFGVDNISNSGFDIMSSSDNIGWCNYVAFGY